MKGSEFEQPTELTDRIFPNLCGQECKVYTKKKFKKCVPQTVVTESIIIRINLSVR